MLFSWMHHRPLVVVIWSGAPQELRGYEWEKLIFWACEPRRKGLWSWHRSPWNYCVQTKKCTRKLMTCSSVEEWFIFSIQTSFQTQDLSPLFLGAEFLSGQLQFQKECWKCLSRLCQILPWVKAYIKTMPAKRFLPPLTPLMSKDHFYFASNSKIFTNLTPGISCTTFPALQRAASPASLMSFGVLTVLPPSIFQDL